MSITPLILGKGRSGQTLAKSLAILNTMQPELNIDTPVWLERGVSLASARQKYSHPILCISNPHGLHADAIIEADKAQFEAIICEKPACVNLEQLQRLRPVRVPTAILHVYRQMWGLQTLKKMVEENRFGELISIEGRYWQASTAERALQKSVNGDRPKAWKDNPQLSGQSDAYLDVGTHWVDAVSFLYGHVPSQITGWRSYVNADSPHRDSHVHLALEFPKGGRAFGSISKTMHGATNHFEINLVGSKLSATWQFLNPDEIFIGEGRDRRVITRKDCEFGSKYPPHHGMGWIDGYIETASCLLGEVYQGRVKGYPRLSDNLDILNSMFKAQWQD